MCKKFGQQLWLWIIVMIATYWDYSLKAAFIRFLIFDVQISINYNCFKWLVDDLLSENKTLSTVCKDMWMMWWWCGVSAATGYLWFTFYQLKTQLDQTPSEQLLEETVHNEKAFFVYSIIATIFTVSTYHKIRTQFNWIE